MAGMLPPLPPGGLSGISGGIDYNSVSRAEWDALYAAGWRGDPNDHTNNVIYAPTSTAPVPAPTPAPKPVPNHPAFHITSASQRGAPLAPVEVAKALVPALEERRERLGQDPTYRPARVVGAGDANTAVVVMDSDIATGTLTSVSSLVGRLQADDRVMVAFVPPQGAFIVGYAQWPAWHGVTYQNGWSDYGNGYLPLQYRLLNGLVRIRGTAWRAAGAVATPAPFATIPWLPGATHRWTSGGEANYSAGNVDTAGTLSLQIALAPVQYVSVDTWFDPA